MPHSPGPWFTIDGTIFSPGVGTVAHVERSNPNHLADKTLILAAPDMLAALETARKARLNKTAKAAISAAIEAALGKES